MSTPPSLTASNGVQALDAIRREKPELVLLDVMMPEMSGLELCNTVKNILGVKDIYILILTAKGQGFDKHIWESIGADAYLAKPFNSDELLEKAVNVLGVEM
ncbi:MAG: response regulator [Candidatus Scalindua sp.]|jgi:DNA-binding response OmpR family regulator|nr:response regulator [Candidatus Scalindua sp.]MBT5304278.1 response regulator [Candidatus Scalindua sp.]MBT6051065.1 response regulator [Candidatus Scalindua sp.]MBT6225817.1 response regulator [Candidatus Scalindua sp.]MBT7212608.1 response regulator [Candidatus Scalindua sp.]